MADNNRVLVARVTSYSWHSSASSTASGLARRRPVDDAAISGEGRYRFQKRELTKKGGRIYYLKLAAMSSAARSSYSIVSGLPCGEGPSGLKMVVRSPADVVLPWSFEAVQ